MSIQQWSRDKAFCFCFGIFYSYLTCNQITSAKYLIQLLVNEIFLNIIQCPSLFSNQQMKPLTIGSNSTGYDVRSTYRMKCIFIK